MPFSPIELTRALVQKKSLTPEDAGCLDLISDLLAKAGFQLERLDAGNVKNLFAHYGNQGPLFVFVGHTDVVPTGPETEWRFPPFSATEHEGYLYGRGAADMKSGVAAMVWALVQFVQSTQSASFRVGVLLTSDEEGVATHGIKHVMEVFKQRDIKIQYCLVGEPSSNKVFGDTIKIGRRGTLSGKLIIYGKQGHIAYPHLADNPIHRFAPVLNELVQVEWDKGNAHFPPTQCQFSNIHAGTGADNVMPGTLAADFNFRFSSESDPENLKQRFEACLQKHRLRYHIEWHLGGLAFLTHRGLLLQSVQQAIQTKTGITPELSTIGGTSDGRFIAPTGAEVVEFGVINQTIHQIDERVKMTDIQTLAEIYLEILKKIVVELKSL